MRIETYNNNKLIELKELDYSKGEWLIYDKKLKLIKKVTLNQEQIEQFNEKQRKNRENDFISESDVLFLKYQAGEIDKQVWLDKRQEIRKRFKYIEKII
jgi:hypothetical protein